MWTSVISAVLPLLTSLAGSTTDNTTLQGILTFLENLIPMLIGEATVLYQPVINLIDELTGNGTVTPAQMVQAEALRDQMHAQIQADAKDDGLTT